MVSSTSWTLSVIATLLGAVFLTITAAQEIYVFERATYSVSESTGYVSVCIRRYGDVTFYSTRSVEVYVSRTTARAGSDFTYSPIFLFQSGALSSCQTINIANDDRNEGTEEFTLTIQGNVALGYPSSTTVSIIDNDNLTDGQIAGIVAGVLIFAIIVSAIILCLVCLNCFTPRPASPVVVRPPEPRKVNVVRVPSLGNGILGGAGGIVVNQQSLNNAGLTPALTVDQWNDIIV